MVYIYMSILFFYIYFEIRKFFMDKQLLKALDNLAFGLETLVDALNKKGAKSDTGTALQAGNFEKSLESITVELKSIKKDTQEILKNQQTIIGLQKQKSADKKTEALEGAGDPKKESQIKKGVSTILLIAVAVLAIGLAFKLVGKVDFLSVIALSTAIYIMSIAFEKVAKLKLGLKEAAIVSGTLVIMALGVTISSVIMSFIKPIGFGQALTGILILGMFALASESISKMVETFSKIGITSLVKGVIFLPIVMIAISIGITMSSWILKSITPIGFGQALTGILIAGLFTVISFGIRKLLGAFKGMDMLSLTKAVQYLPLVLPAIALGIALSSWVLQLIVPISFAQALTGILIAAMFTVVSFGINKIINAMDKVDPEDVILLPIILPAIALAITASSWIMSMITPITFMQFLTAVGISLVFVVLSFALSKVMEPIKKLSFIDLLKLPTIFTLMSLAIMLSSHILSLTKPIEFMFLLKILAFSLVVSISLIAVGIAAFVLSKIGVTNIAKGASSIVILSIAISISSLIISKGVYNKYPSWKWSLSTTLSLALFGGVAWLLNKLGAVNILKGSLVIVLLAAIILVTSKILNLGSYKNYPSLKWALGVGLALTAFGVGALALGVMVFGPQGLIFAAGLGAILVVSATIVAASKILSKGKYNNPGMLSWAMSTALLYATFAPIILILGTIGVAANAMGAIFGKGANPFEVGREMILSIAKTIVGVSYILAKGTYKGGPTKQWAEGIAIALGAFAPVYEMLVRSSIFKIFGASGVSPKDFSKAIVTVSRGIIEAAHYFAQNKAAFKNGPSKAWSEGVGIAIGAFAPVFKFMEDFPFSGGYRIAKAMKHVAHAIVNVAEILNKSKTLFKEGNYPSKKWGEGVGTSIKAFVPIFKYMSENSSWLTGDDEVIDNMKYAMVKIATGIKEVAGVLAGGEYTTYPSKKWAWGVGNSIKRFIYMANSLADIEYSSIFKVQSLVSRMVGVAGILHSGDKYFKTKIDPNYFKNMSKSMLEFNILVKKIAESENGSKMGTLFFNDPITQVARRMITLAKGYDTLAKSLMRLGTAMRMLNVKNLQQLGNLTKGLTTSEQKSELKTIKTPMSRQFGQTDDGEPIKSKKITLNPIEKKKNEISYVSEQLEKVVKILKNIDRSTSTIDEYIADSTGNRIVAPPPMAT